ncbi:MAG: prolipoprotein diacylglyceryl transferase [Pseudomonadota bacterium]|nr:prolipoprotein diacylglyceryl transferase [Pseudomonadota bacterium]
MAAFVFPPLDPVALALGPIVIRWYALAYLAGFILGWRMCLFLARQNATGPRPEFFDEFLTWAVLGVVLGGRIGYVVFYQPDFYAAHPEDILKVWHGGMSFHGGLIGVITATAIYTRVYKLKLFAFLDLLACVTPIGLGLGRLANFVNGELYGRVTTVPWGVVFPRGGVMPRHPSQLYEAFLEGAVLFAILFALSQKKKIRAHPGCLSGCFLVGYGLFRFFVEFFREPDAQLGFLFAGATMGQLLCIPMIAVGIGIIAWSQGQTHPSAVLPAEITRPGSANSKRTSGRRKKT